MITNTDTETTTTDSPATSLGAIAILVGLVGFIVSVPTDSDAARMVAMAGLFGGLALLAVGRAGAPAASADPTAAPAAAVGLAGSRINVGHDTFTVLDDSAAAGDGRRCSVVARDEAGQVGLLYLGFGPGGEVTEARIDGQAWAPATLID